MFSFHTHSEFCDGKSTMEEFCNRALKLGFQSIGFTSHAPVPFHNNFSIRFEKLQEYMQMVDANRSKFSDRLQIFMGLEADYIPGITVRFDEWQRLVNTDFIIGSVHLVRHPESGELWFIDGPSENFVNGLDHVFHNDAENAVRCYFKQVREMVLVEKPCVIGHIDKVKMNNQDRFFLTSDQFYMEELEETLNVVKNSGSIVEINSRGIYRGRYHESFPSISVVKRCLDLNIPLTLASDSHQVDELQAGFDLAYDIAHRAGVKEIMVYEQTGWSAKALNDFKPEHTKSDKRP